MENRSKQISTNTNPDAAAMNEDEVYLELEETWDALQARYANAEIELPQLLVMLSSAVNHLAKKL